MSTFDNYGSIVSEKSIDVAIVLKDQLNKCIKSAGETPLDKISEQFVFETFAFMNLSIAMGVWSTNNDTSLRRNLLTSTKTLFIMQLSSIISNSKTPEDMAAISVNIDFDKLQPYVIYVKQKMNEYNSGGVPLNANVDLLIALEWIQAKMNWSDDFMERFIPQFIPKTIILEEVESVAASVIEEASK